MVHILRNATYSVLMVFFLATPSYGFVDAIYGFLKDKQDEFALVQQYAELIKIQKEIDFKLQTLNDFSETISDQTKIKLNSTDEAVRFLTDDYYREQKVMDGLLSQDYFQRNEEASRALRKLSQGQDLSIQDVAGVGEYLVLGESDELVIRRLQRKGYTYSQIKKIMDMKKRVEKNQEELISLDTEILNINKRIQKNKELKKEADTKYKESETPSEKNKAREESLTLEQLIQGDNTLLLEKQQEKNELLAMQSKLMSLLRTYEISFTFDAIDRENLIASRVRRYQIRKDKAASAEELMQDFMDYVNINFGRGY